MKSGGFNLVGMSSSPTGLGEDLRMFAAMLDYLGIAYRVEDIAMCTEAPTHRHFIFSKSDEYDVTIVFSIPPTCCALRKLRPHLLADKRLTVGFFPWELPDFPLSQIDSLAHVDQIWTPSRFARDAFQRASNQPAFALPLPTQLAAAAGEDIRHALGIPANDFVVLYVFDLRSTPFRKNPEAAIRAFLDFVDDKDDAWLILKTHISGLSSDRKDILAMLTAHPRIHIISETCSPAKLVDLYNAADCYLSLHRSEGYGRTLVEAMQCGLPLVITDFSGPADFTDTSVARYVRWARMTVHPWQYIFRPLSWWADPDAADATLALNEIYADRRRYAREKIREYGKRFSVAALATNYENFFDACLNYRGKHDLSALSEALQSAMPSQWASDSTDMPEF